MTTATSGSGNETPSGNTAAIQKKSVTTILDQLSKTVKAIPMEISSHQEAGVMNYPSIVVPQLNPSFSTFITRRSTYLGSHSPYVTTTARAASKDHFEKTPGTLMATPSSANMN